MIFLYAGKDDTNLLDIVKNTSDISEEEIIKKIEPFLKNGTANINAQVKTDEDNGWTALHYAAKKGYFNVVKFLVDGTVNINNKTYASGKNANIDVVDKSNKTPFLFAVQSAIPKDKDYEEKKEIIKFLLEKGAKSNAGTSYAEMPLYQAGRNCAKDVIALLLEKGADIEAVPAKDFFEIIAKNGCSETIKFIAENMGEKKLKSLITTAEKKNFSILATLKPGLNDIKGIIELLIKNGADVNKKFNENSPLVNAVTEQHFKKAKSLLEASQDINVNDSDTGGWSPLQIIFEFGAQSTDNDGLIAEIIQLLLEKGAIVSDTVKKAAEDNKKNFKEFPKVLEKIDNAILKSAKNIDNFAQSLYSIVG